MDRSRRRPAHAAAVPSEAASYLEELQAAHLYGGPNGGQLYPDEERPQDVPLSTTYRRGSGSRGNG